MKKYKSVYYAIYENLKNIGNFREYLIENSESVIFFHFPHGYANSPSYFEIYKEGKLEKKRSLYKVPGSSNIFKLFIYYVYFQYILFRYVPNNSYVIVDSPIFCLLNSISTHIKQARFIYWIGDYYPDNKGFMKIYNSLVDFYNRKLKIVWFVSPPIMKIYQKKIDHPTNDTMRRMLVSLGTKSNRRVFRKKISKPVKLGFVGVLREQQGLDLVFSYLRHSNESVLEIVGSGYKLDHYKNLAKKMNLNKKVKFYGYIEDMGRIASKWDIGIALYENKANNVSVYCEPTKIKNYLEFGLPVITTKATYFYKELEEKKAGLAIDEKIESMDEAVREVSLNYAKYKKGVKIILNKYEYANYYNSLLTFMQKKP